MRIKKIIFFLCVLSTISYCKIENMELLADEVTKEGNTTIANGNVLVFSQSYLATADKAMYHDDDNSSIELFGNVNFMTKDGYISRSSYTKLYLENNNITSDASFMMNKQNEVWIQSDNACDDKEYYNTSGSVVSSCNVNDPDWSIKFTSGMMNKESKYLHLFNPRFYIGSVPIFYMPYFGFPTDKTRRTGLLIPSVGYKQKEGLFYRQPIYFAPQDRWDLELDPQIRTNRGSGIYGTFRFVDSMDSRGSITTGIFKEKKSYQEEQNLKNDSHKGFELKYERNKLAKYLLDDSYKEGLWIDYTSLRDVEYLKLQNTGSDNDYDDSLVTSRLNYFLSKDNHYIGLYGRYYVDLYELASKGNNDKTVQELPTIQYHKFVDSLFIPKLLYSADLMYHRYDRDIGTTANQVEFNLPVTWSTDFMDEYLKFVVKENLYTTKVNYSKNKTIIDNQLENVKDNDYINTYTQFALSTELSKAYSNFFHTINFAVDYVIPGYEKNSIDKKIYNGYDDLSNINLFNRYLEDNFVTSMDEKYLDETSSASMVQYFYNKDGRKVLRHSVESGYNVDKDKYLNLKHRVSIFPYSNLSLHNKFEYDFNEDIFEKIQSMINYSHSIVSLGLWHNYENKGKRKNTQKYDKEEYFGATGLVNINRYYSVFGGFGYDFENDYTKTWSAGLNYRRKCWGYTIKFKEDLEPEFTSAGPGMEKKKAVYLYFDFYPIGSVGYDYSTTQYSGNQ